VANRKICRVKTRKKVMMVAKSDTIRKELLARTKRKVGVVTLSFLMGIRAHHGTVLDRKSPPISSYVLFCLNERTVLNINLSVYELRRLFLGLKLRCAWKETLIMNVPVKKGEIRVKLKKIAGGYFHFFDDWVGGTLTNFRFFFRYIRRLGAKINATSLFLSKESQRMLKGERNLKGIGNVQKMPQVPSVFVGFGTAHWPLNEAVSLGLQTFLFIDADYKGQFANGLIPFGNSLMTIEKIMEIFALSIGEIKLSEKFYWMDYPAARGILYLPFDDVLTPGKKIYKAIRLPPPKWWEREKYQGVKYVYSLPEDIRFSWKNWCRELATERRGSTSFAFAEYLSWKNEKGGRPGKKMRGRIKDIRYYQKGIPLVKIEQKVDYKKKEMAKITSVWEFRDKRKAKEKVQSVFVGIKKRKRAADEAREAAEEKRQEKVRKEAEEKKRKKQ